MQKTFKLFTSELQITAPEEFINLAEEEINEISGKFYSQFDIWNNPSARTKETPPLLRQLSLGACTEIVSGCEQYSKDKGLDYIDFTSCVKGLFLGDLINRIESRMGHYKIKTTHWVMNFGGDCVGYVIEPVSLYIRGSKTIISITNGGFFCCFTSGNFDKRGKHIHCFGEEPYFKSLTTFYREYKSNKIPEYNVSSLLSLLDYTTTRSYSLMSKDRVKRVGIKEPQQTLKFKNINSEVVRYWVTHDGVTLIGKDL